LNRIDIQLLSPTLESSAVNHIVCNQISLFVIHTELKISRQATSPWKTEDDDDDDDDDTVHRVHVVIHTQIFLIYSMVYMTFKMAASRFGFVVSSDAL